MLIRCHYFTQQAEVIRVQDLCSFKTLHMIQIHFDIDGIWTPFGTVRPIQNIKHSLLMSFLAKCGRFPLRRLHMCLLHSIPS